MILGRYFGTLLAVIVAMLFNTGNYFIDFFLAIFIAALGLLVGVFISMILGINFKTEQPTEKDGLKYWTDRYGEDMGKAAYEMWLKSLK